MNKNDMDNETTNKTAGMNQGKTEGASQGKSTGKSAGGSQGQGTATGGSNMPTASWQSAGARAGQGREEEGVLSQVQESGKDIASKGLQAISDKTRSTTEGYKSELTGGLHTLANGLRQTSSSFRTGGEQNALASAGAKYIGDLADRIESVSGYFERKDATDLFRDVKGFARRNPTVFVGGAFVVGFALSRVIRTGASASTAGSGSVGLRRGNGGERSPMGSGAGSSATPGSATGSSTRGNAAESPVRG
ncbi:MAG: hypothetical protein PSX80_04160 [bacterium]|nr:hypothetical protein [bacterium]